MRLTDTHLRKLKPAARYRDIADDGSGLTARLKSDGAIIWIWRGKQDGIRTKRQIGTFPEMGVADARSFAAALRSEARAAEFKPVPRPKVVPRRITVEAAFERYSVEHLPNLASGEVVKGQMKLRILPVFGERDIRSLTRSELNDHFNEMKSEYRGAGINRVLAQTKAFLNWAMRENLIDQNPCVAIQMKAKEKARRRVMKGAELGYLMRGIDGMGPYREPLSLLLLTAARLADIFSLQWGEVEFENGKPTELHIKNTKAGIPHIVPLSAMSEKFVPTRPDDAKDQDFVFPAISRARGSSYLTKIRKLTSEAAIASGQNQPVEHFTIHDWRTFTTTYLSDQIGRGKYRFTDRALDMLLAHVPHGVTKRHYNQSDCLDERTEMMSIWGDYLEKCKIESFK